MVVEYRLNKKCLCVQQNNYIPQIGTKVIYQGQENEVIAVKYDLSNKIVKVILK